MQAEPLDGHGVNADPLLRALRFFAYRDLMDAELYADGNAGWTPMTTQYTRRLRELNQQGRTSRTTSRTTHSASGNLPVIPRCTRSSASH